MDKKIVYSIDEPGLAVFDRIDEILKKGETPNILITRKDGEDVMATVDNYHKDNTPRQRRFISGTLLGGTYNGKKFEIEYILSLHRSTLTIFF